MNDFPESVAGSNGAHDVRGTESSDSSLDSLPTDEFLRVVGLRVRKQRSALSMSRKRLAEVSGVSERYLAQLESGQGNMSIALLRKVTTAIGVSLAALLSANMPEAHAVGNHQADASSATMQATDVAAGSISHDHEPASQASVEIHQDETSLV